MAAGNAIGSGSVILTTNADGLTSGLAKASADVHAWGQKTGHGLSQSLVGSAAGGAVGGGIAAFIHKIGAGFGPIGQLVTGAIALVPGAIEAGLETSMAHLDKFGKTAKRADILGVRPSEMMGFELLFKKVGIEGEAANTVFAKMGKNILESHGAAKQLAAMHILPADIKNKTFTDQFKMIADGISKLPKGAEQAAASLTLFGKSGASLLPMLQRGSKGIDDFIANQKKFGGILSDEQLKAAGGAAKSLKAAKESISVAWDGLINRLTITGAPVLKMIADGISRAFTLAAPVVEWVGRLIDRVGSIAGIAFDMIQTGIDETIQWWQGLGTQLGDFGSDWMTIEEVVTKGLTEWAEVGGAAFDAIKRGIGYVAVGIGKMTDGFADAIVQFKDVVDLMKLLPDSMRPAGLDGFIAGMDKAAEKTRTVGKYIEAWSETASKTVIGQTFDAFQARLKALLAPKPSEEHKGITSGADAAGKSKNELGGAIERGTKEAYSIEMRAKYGTFGKGEDHQKENGKKHDKTNDKLDELIKRLGHIEDSAAAMEVI